MVRRQAATTRQRGPAIAKETRIADLLEDARCTDFGDEAACKRFQETHRARLNKDPNINYLEDEVLNKLAREGDLGNLQMFVKWAVQSHKKLLLCKTDGGHTPLHLAIRSKNHEFVGLVLQYADKIQDLLSEKSHLDMTCLHFAIHYRSPFTEEIIAKALGNSETDATVPDAATHNHINGISQPVIGPTNFMDIFVVQSKDQENKYEGMTPLHIAVVAEEHDAEDDNYLNQPPPQSSATKFQGSSTKIKQYSAVELESPVEVADKFIFVNKGLQRSRTADMTKTALSRGSEVQRDDLKLLRKARPFRLLDVVKKLADANPRVLVDYKDADGNTPFQALVELERKFLEDSFAAQKTEERREAKRHEMIDSDQILLFLRSYIIDKFDRRDAMKALYKVGDGKSLLYSSILQKFY